MFWTSQRSPSGVRLSIAQDLTGDNDGPVVLSSQSLRFQMKCSGLETPSRLNDAVTFNLFAC